MPSVYKQSFKKNDPMAIDLSIYNCGLQSCAQGYTWGPGIRDHYLIHLVTSGSGQLCIGQRTFSISAGDLFLVKPSQLVSYTADMECPWEYYWVGFNGAGAARLVLRLPFLDNSPVHRCRDAGAARELLHKIYLSRGPSAGDETRMVGNLYQFLAFLMDEAGVATHQSHASGEQYVGSAVKYIQFNYSREIGVDDIARAIGVSRSHLYRVFMSHMGKSPIDYLTGFRIDQACSLLESSQLSVAEVAYSVGFFDQFYFSRVFKKSKGIPPSRYLESLDKNKP